MILYGTGLGPATLVSISANPLPTSLSPGNQREVARYVATGSDYRKLQNLREGVHGQNRIVKSAACVWIYGGHLTITFTDVSATMPTLNWSAASPLRVSTGRRKFTW